jgi:hypothetical protein
VCGHGDGAELVEQGVDGQGPDRGASGVEVGGQGADLGRQQGHGQRSAEAVGPVLVAADDGGVQAVAGVVQHGLHLVGRDAVLDEPLADRAAYLGGPVRQRDTSVQWSWGRPQRGE